MTSLNRTRVLAAADCSRSSARSIPAQCAAFPGGFAPPVGRQPEMGGLVSTYAELARVDGALRVAEHNLLAAHRQHLDRKPLEAQDIYVEVLGLRKRVRQLLGELSELWVRADGCETGVCS